MAERILPRRATSFSKVSATLTRTWSRKPPISPARTMETYRRLKTLGWRARAADSEVPFSTSARTWTMTSPRRRLLVCSPRMVRARSRDRPELIMVANCLGKTARSLSLTRPAPGSLTSALRPAPFSASIEIGA
jgi:hypothetical protein